MIKYGLIGSNVEDSFSREIHEDFLYEKYGLFSLKTETEFKNFLNNDFRFVNITIPYKELACKCCNQISQTAKETGVVNTIIKRNNKMFGYNTDIDGFECLLNKNNISIRNKIIAIFGTGASSKTISYVLKKLGAFKIKIISRTPKLFQCGYDQVKKYNDAQIIINTTPIGNLENKDIALLDDLSSFTSLEAYIDINYNVYTNKQSQIMKAHGIKVVNGLSMLISQAIKTEELYQEKKFGIETYNNTYLKIFCKKYNIVLIGHPCSGKTTIAQELASSLGMKFIDTDALIVEKVGKPIQQIFEENGEDFFRKVESEVIDSIVQSKGQVISTGGGAILNEENGIKLQESGVVINLFRQVEEIKESDVAERPLLGDLNNLVECINKRKDFYSKYADLEIENKSIKSTIEKIKESL